MKTIGVVFLAITGCGLFVVMCLCCAGCGWVSEANTVAHEQFGARNALKKYEWFKDAHAQLQSKLADIKVYEARLATAEKRAAAPNADRTDRERVSIAESELSGMVASYNALVAEYNSASSKFTWSSFQGEVPREVVSYKERTR